MDYLFMYYTPYMLAAYMDFAVGIFLTALLYPRAFKIYPSFWNLFAGGALALLPDIDTLGPILLGHLQEDHHQYLTHRPIVMIPVGAALGYVLDRRRGAVLGSLCVLWHFVHDTKGFGGGGIAWGWPWSELYWSLTGSETPQWAEHLNAGMRTMWHHGSREALLELLLGSGALLGAAALLGSVRYVLLGGAISYCVWAVALTQWQWPLQHIGSAFAGN